MSTVYTARKVLMSEVSGVRVRGWPRFRLNGWCKGGLGLQRDDSAGCETMSEGQEAVESLVHMLIEFYAAILFVFCVLSNRPPAF